MVSLAYPVRLLLAVLAYLALYVICSNLAWALRAPRPGRLGQVVELARAWGARLLLGDVLRLAYYLGAPYLTLYYGWVSPLDLGLANLDWIRGIGMAVALGTACLLVLVFVWWQYMRLVDDRPTVQQAQWLKQPWGWALVLREAIFAESWLALCRSPTLLLAGPYFGVYLGLGMLWAAVLLDARTWYELSVHGHREQVILTGSLAVVTSTLYVFVRNLWLCMALHVILRMAVLNLLCLKGAAERPPGAVPGIGP